jgi:hypothetical protein
MPLNPRSWETDPKKILVAVRSLKNFSARGLEEPTVHQRYVKFGVPLDLFNLRCEHRLCTSLSALFLSRSRFNINPSLEHPDLYGIKTPATGNGVPEPKDPLFIHGELYSDGLPFMIKDCLTWCSLSLSLSPLHESGCPLCICFYSSVAERRKQSTSVSVLVRALQGGKTHPGRDQSSICVHSLTSLERDVACCHGAHGLAVNSVVPITPVNLMAPYTISSWRWYLQTHLPPKGITKTTHTGV